MDEESPTSRLMEPMLQLRMALRKVCGADMARIHLDPAVFLTLRDAEGDWLHLPPEDRPESFTIAGVEILPLEA